VCAGIRTEETTTVAKKKSKGAQARADGAPVALPIEATGDATPGSENAGQGVESPAKPRAGQMRKKEYRRELGGLQVDLFKLQSRVVGEKLRLVVILEGLGPAGKRGAARRIAEGLDQRVCKVVMLEPPNKRTRARWHFQRFVEHFPVAGKMVILDGSWYHYPATTRALGLTSEAEFEEFLRACAEFEHSLVLSGITLAKFWFSAEDDEQDRRFRAHLAGLAKKRQLPVPALPKDAQPVEVAAVRQTVLSLTSAEQAPWHVIPADDRRRARLQCMAELLELVPGAPSPSYRIEQPAPHADQVESDI
jgi:polyphosphate kinase 2 (PPK2 family)